MLRFSVELVVEEDSIVEMTEAIADFCIQLGIRIASRKCFYRNLAVKRVEA